MSDQGPYLPRPKVLYIGGTGRTGSTLLTRLLGEVPGWFAAGELAFLWRHGLQSGGRCACGETLATCEVWSGALAGVKASGHTIDPDRMVALRKKCWSAHLPLMAIPGVANRCFDRLEEFPAVVESLYQNLASVAGCSVIVDSSKEPHYSWILRERTDLDVYFLHLVRDPRAVAHSWRRRRDERGFDDASEMETRSPSVAATYYTISNTAADVLWSRRPNYRLLRYEDFVADPAATLDEIADFIDEPIGTTPLRDGVFTATGQHLAWGNPNRFDEGAVRIRRDDGWKNAPEAEQMGHQDHLVMAMTMAHRYGYPLRRSGVVRPVRRGRQRRSQIATNATAAPRRRDTER